jgi:hypothetical protein
VRGASGELALEVLRRRGDSTFLIARTPFLRMPDRGLHLLSANLPLRAGDLVGLGVAPDAGVGVRDASGATTRRRFGTDVSAEAFGGSQRDQELMLRVEYLPGAAWRPAGRLTGRAAARAPGGRTLDVLELQGKLSVAAVTVGGRIAADLFSGQRRIARLFVPRAAATGQLGSLYTLRVRFGQPIVRLAWRNPRGLVNRDFSVSARSLVPLY